MPKLGYSFFSVVLKIFTGLLIVRIILSYFSNEFYLMYYDYLNISTIMLSISGGSMNTGVIKLVAQTSDDYLKYKKLISELLSIILILYLLTILLTLVSLFFFSSNHISNGILIFTSITIVIRSFTMLIEGIANGKLKISLLFWSNVILLISSLISLYFVRYLNDYDIYFYLFPITYIPVLFYLYKKIDFNFSFDFKNIRKSRLMELFKYSSYSLVTVLSISFSMLFFRDILLERSSIEWTSNWQAMMSISMSLITIISAPVSILLLPKIASENKIYNSKSSSLFYIVLLWLATSFIILISSDLIELILFNNKIELSLFILSILMFTSLIRIISQLLTQFYLAEFKIFYIVIGEIIYFSISLSLPFIFINEISVVYSYCLGSIISLTYLILKSNKLNKIKW